ncbi:co-chaperone GroES [bacterium]|nr:co-chaperone GroES [bacterium]
MSKVRPLGERVIVKPNPREEKTAGGLFIPDTAKEKPQQGEVIAVGPGRKAEDGTLLPMELKVGDKVLYGKYAGTELKMDGEVYLIVKESDILAVI